MTRFVRVTPDGGSTPIERAMAAERAVAVEYDGIGYAVTMATPADLEDFAWGYSLAERVVARADEVLGVEAAEVALGTVLRVALAPGRRAAVMERVRHRVAGSSCGLCGIENLEQALRPLPRVAGRAPEPAALFRAVAALRGHQPLNRATGAVHAALLCAADGTVRLAREDVGRHNALDKLVGAMLREGLTWDGGFALMSSRCSFELVEKAVLAGCPALATVSAATELAHARAAEAGLALVCLARDDAALFA